MQIKKIAVPALIVVIIVASLSLISGNDKSNTSRINPSSPTTIAAAELANTDSVDEQEPSKRKRLSKDKPGTDGPGTKLNKRQLKKLEIDSVEEELLYYISDTTPNDPIYPQWYTTITSAPAAWDLSQGTSDTLVAVIDTGHSLNHEDLVNNYFVNSGETGNTSSGDTCWTGSPEDKSTNACDDDGNSYIDDHQGWDFSNADNNPQAGDNYAPGATHGTIVSGFVSAAGNNSTGVAAINWNTKILPLQGLYDQGFGYTSDIVAAIIYAVDMGADVINMSLGGSSPDDAMRAATAYAQDNNVIVVAAAGNCGFDPANDPNCAGTPVPGGMEYPGRYAKVIAIGATNSGDSRASFSSYGKELDFVAPGSGSLRSPTWSSASPNTTYTGSAYGTSFSSPIVASAVAMIKGIIPDANFNDIYHILRNSVDKPAGMGGADWHEEYGYGRLNVYQAVLEALDYNEDVEKGDSTKHPLAAEPSISSNTGHTNATAIPNGENVITYCYTSPNTACTLSISEQNSSSEYVSDPKLSNSQGIARFAWNTTFLPGSNDSGIWDLSVEANSLTSVSESIYID